MSAAVGSGAMLQRSEGVPAERWHGLATALLSRDSQTNSPNLYDWRKPIALVPLQQAVGPNDFRTLA
jgi:hypothetical protein